MAFQGCLVNKSAAQTGANYSAQTVINWDAEVYDTDSAHDNVTNNNRITIPSAWNGKYGVLTACLSIQNAAANTADFNFIIRRNVPSLAAITGKMQNTAGNGQATTSCWMQICTVPILLNTSDWWDVSLVCHNDTSIDIMTESAFGCYVHANPSVLQQVLVKKSANETAANYTTPTVVPWNTNVYDTIGGMLSSNQLVIPSALNGAYVIVTAQIVSDQSAGNNVQSLAIRKNGSLTWAGIGANSCLGYTNFISAGVGESRLQAVTHPIQVSTGDTFDVLYYYNTDTSIDIQATRSTFGLRVVG